MKLLLEIIVRDLRIHLRGASEMLNPLVFFVVVISLFPLGVGPAPETLAEIAPAIIWIAALLATLMSMDLMFSGDYGDGSLEQMVASGQSLMIIVLGKIIGHWLVTGLPLMLLSPVIGLVLYVEQDSILVTMLALLLVTPVLSLLGAIGAALTVGLERGGLLVTIIVLPLYVPLLVLGTAMVQAAMLGDSVTGYVYWLLAAMMGAMTLSPLAVAASLRVAVDQ